MSIALPVGPDEATQSDRARSDQWPTPAETRRRDPSAATERQLGMLVECFLGRIEEGRAEAERNRSTDDGEIEIEQVADRRDGLADEPTGALHDLVSRLRVWAAGDGLDRRAGSLGLETTA